MKLLLLGSGGYHPSDQRHTMCLMIPECSIVLDAGTGIFRLADFLQSPELDLFLSHAHLDHVVGLSYLLGVMRSHRLRRVTIHGLPDKLDAIDKHLFHEDLFPLKPSFQYQPLSQGLTLSCGAAVRHFPLAHPGGSLGYRFDWPGTSLAYVTDTTADPEAAYVEEIRGVKLLVHECFVPDRDAQWAVATGHSSTTAVAQVASRAGVGRLVLVHISPQLKGDELDLKGARTVFPATELGADLMQIEF